MKEKVIRLATVDEVKAFVSAAMKCDFDIDVCYNRIVIDGKSILGVFSLDLRNDLVVRLHGEDEAFEELLDSLAPAEKRVEKIA
ncbi:MAG TPA: HPr family phosphocarrier protein [Candidatus Ventrimonas merdavium]|nr:HPr family phosphocarrier protein [Candidatus Ventrimonas merdavium]